MAETNGPYGSQDEALQTLIGKQLRTLYDSVLSEPIPNKIVDLLIKLDDLTSDRGTSPKPSSPNGKSAGHK